MGPRHGRPPSDQADRRRCVWLSQHGRTPRTPRHPWPAHQRHRGRAIHDAGAVQGDGRERSSPAGPLPPRAGAACARHPAAPSPAELPHRHMPQLQHRRLGPPPSLYAPGDVLFMGPVFNRTRAEELLRAIHPRAVIFVHWDNLFRPFTAPERPLLSPAAASMARERRWAEKVIPRARVPCPEVLKRYDLEDLLSESDERPGLSGPRRSS